MHRLSRSGILAVALAGLVALPAHADPVTDALVAVGSTIGAQSAVCATGRSLTVPHIAWYRDTTTVPGTIAFVWSDSATAQVSPKCPGVRVTLRISDYAGAATVNVTGSFIYRSPLCGQPSSGTSATAACSLWVPYYSADGVRSTSTVVVEAVAWNQGVQYACTTVLYSVVATPREPEFVAENVETGCATTT
jgi:hypothetical protein